MIRERVLTISTLLALVALSGVAAETGVVMLIYLDGALAELQAPC
jgi:copper/silver efflux system protein